MKQTIRSFALGIFLSVTLLAAIFFLENNEEKEPAVSVSEMIETIESEGYEVYTHQQAESLKNTAVQEKTDSKQETEQKEEQEDKPAETVITVTEGMTTSQLVNQLTSAEIIEDEQSFIDFLIENDYSKKIQIGKFGLEKDMTYKEIAERLTGK
ncbi:endolytic transglycosylase MltG [Sediminibacillus massiliensis]|uniref:endolytic transglycosylase MltG n=1 Tax=Sediminibacillus massiliensis TaxID=1926277 RepID=UPI00098830B0|nr:endolytic transglycosylase MltG [Sediminibacillus massiliensis]